MPYSSLWDSWLLVLVGLLRTLDIFLADTIGHGGGIDDPEFQVTHGPGSSYPKTSWTFCWCRALWKKQPLVDRDCTWVGSTTLLVLLTRTQILILRVLQTKYITCVADKIWCPQSWIFQVFRQNDFVVLWFWRVGFVWSLNPNNNVAFFKHTDSIENEDVNNKIVIYIRMFSRHRAVLIWRNIKWFQKTWFFFNTEDGVKKTRSE